MHLLSPGTSVGCKRLPSVGVDSQRLELTRACVLEAQLGSLGWPLSCRQFSVERVLGDKAVLIAGDWASQRRSLCFSVVYIGGGPFPLNLCVFGCFVSPGDAQDASEAAHEERFQSSF